MPERSLERQGSFGSCERRGPGWSWTRSTVTGRKGRRGIEARGALLGGRGGEGRGEEEGWGGRGSALPKQSTLPTHL